MLNDLVGIRRERAYVLEFAKEIGAAVIDCNSPGNIDLTTLLKIPAELETFREKYICTEDAVALETIFRPLLQLPD